MSILAEALRETSSVVADLEHGRAHGARLLRARVDLVTTASKQIQRVPDSHPETLALHAVARELLDEAVELRRIHRIVRGCLLAMMD
jgi:hypothetical protein